MQDIDVVVIGSLPEVVTELNAGAVPVSFNPSDWTCVPTAEVVRALVVESRTDVFHIEVSPKGHQALYFDYRKDDKTREIKIDVLIAGKDYRIPKIPYVGVWWRSNMWRGVPIMPFFPFLILRLWKWHDRQRLCLRGTDVSAARERAANAIRQILISIPEYYGQGGMDRRLGPGLYFGGSQWLPREWIRAGGTVAKEFVEHYGVTEGCEAQLKSVAGGLLYE